MECSIRRCEIEDSSGSVEPLIIEYATPTNTLYLDSNDNGRVGIGTSSPETALDITNGIAFDTNAAALAGQDGIHIRDTSLPKSFYGFFSFTPLKSVEKILERRIDQFVSVALFLDATGDA